MNSVCSTKIRPSKKYPEIGRPSRFLSFIIFVAERANDQDEVEAQKPKLFLVTRDAHRGRRSISKEFLILKTKSNINISARQKVSPDFAKIFAICHHLSLSGNLTLPSSTTFDHFIESAKIKQNSYPRSGNGAIVLQYYSLALFIAPFPHFLCFLFIFHVSCQLFYFLRPISIISILRI